MRKVLSRQRSIPQPENNVNALFASVDALKEVVERLAGQRGAAKDVAVTWGDLVEAGVIKPEQVPTNVGS